MPPRSAPPLPAPLSSNGAALEIQGRITVGAEALSSPAPASPAAVSCGNISGNNTFGGAITLTGDAASTPTPATLTLSGNIGGTQNLCCRRCRQRHRLRRNHHRHRLAPQGRWPHASRFLAPTPTRAAPPSRRHPVGTTTSLQGDSHRQRQNVTFSQAGNGKTLCNVISGTGSLTKPAPARSRSPQRQYLRRCTTSRPAPCRSATRKAPAPSLGDVTDNATLAFSRSDNITSAMSSPVPGAITKLGTNTLTLTRNDSYAG